MHILNTIMNNSVTIHRRGCGLMSLGDIASCFMFQCFNNDILKNTGNEDTHSQTGIYFRAVMISLLIKHSLLKCDHMLFCYVIYCMTVNGIALGFRRLLEQNKQSEDISVASFFFFLTIL